jgi:prephenate dehydratase
VCLAHAKKSDIKIVSSHLQALSQCKKYLHKNFSNAEKEAVSSTGAAIQKLLAANDKSIAVIAPAIAAHDPKLKVLATNIADEEENETTFVAIKKGGLSLTQSTLKSDDTTHKTFIAFYFSANAPGTLFTVFQDFANAKINLTKIESRPTQKSFGDYIFYLDFNGHISDPNIQKTLQLVSQKVAELRILGSY